MSDSKGRPITPAYAFFYVLFSQDTWRILIGIGLAVLLVPRILPPDLTMPGRVMLYIMVATIGWAVSGKPVQWIATGLKRVVLGNRAK